jgi:hypothetical protein
MQRARTVVGLIAGVILVLSSFAHSLLGWPQVRFRLDQAQAPADLITGLAIGWHFAGVAMLAFGVIVILLFTSLMKGRTVAILPALLIAVCYLAFGVWALVASNMDPFFLIFIIPGSMLLFASWGVAPATPPSGPWAKDRPS